MQWREGFALPCPAVTTSPSLRQQSQDICAFHSPLLPTAGNPCTFYSKRKEDRRAGGMGYNMYMQCYYQEKHFLGGGGDEITYVYLSNHKSSVMPLRLKNYGVEVRYFLIKPVPPLFHASCWNRWRASPKLLPHCQ